MKKIYQCRNSTMKLLWSLDQPSKRYSDFICQDFKTIKHGPLFYLSRINPIIKNLFSKISVFTIPIQTNQDQIFVFEEIETKWNSLKVIFMKNIEKNQLHFILIIEKLFNKVHSKFCFELKEIKRHYWL